MANTSHSQKSNPVGTIVAGTVGAAIGATAAVVLSDKKNREKISGFIQDTAERVQDAQQHAQGYLDKAKDVAEEKVEQVTDGHAKDAKEAIKKLKKHT